MLSKTYHPRRETARFALRNEFLSFSLVFAPSRPKTQWREINGAIWARAADVARRGPGDQRRKTIQNGAASH
jgi:hypothetical protein